MIVGSSRLRRGGHRLPVFGGGVAGLLANKKVLIVGDSTSVGVGAGSGGSGNVNGSRPLCYPLQAVAYLKAAGIPAIANSVVGDNNNGITQANWNGYRSDLTVNGTLAAAAATPTAGGVQVRTGTTSGVTLAFADAWDTLEIWQPRVSGTSVLSINVDSLGVQTVSANNATPDVVHNTNAYTGLSVNTHSLVMTSQTSSAYLPIINAYSSQQKSIQMLNAGARNWTTADWTGTTNAGPNNPITSIGNIAADIVVIDLGINDSSAMNVATFKTNMQTIINAAKTANPSVILTLVVPNPISSYSGSFDFSANAMLQAYTDLQAANAGSVLIDSPMVIYQAYPATTNPGALGSRVNTYSSLAGAGLYPNLDGLHPGSGIYQAMGYAVGAAIKQKLGL